jgi:acyl-CoA thioesterase FadM
VTELDKLWDHPAPHTLRTRVGTGDIDGLDHTNNAVYVKWCEQVAWSHSVALGLDLEPAPGSWTGTADSPWPAASR